MASIPTVLSFLVISFLEAFLLLSFFLLILRLSLMFINYCHFTIYESYYFQLYLDRELILVRWFKNWFSICYFPRLHLFHISIFGRPISSMIDCSYLCYNHIIQERAIIIATTSMLKTNKAIMEMMIYKLSFLVRMPFDVFTFISIF